MINISTLQESSVLPKYQKVYQYINEQIAGGFWPIGSKLPSIIDLSIEFNLSKDTIEKAYQQLLKEGTIKSVPRRGYFVDIAKSRLKKVLLIIAGVTFENKSLHEILMEKLNDQVVLMTYCCNQDTDNNVEFLQTRIESFDYFILSPFKADSKCDLTEIANILPKEKQLFPLNTANDDDLEILGYEINRLLEEHKEKIGSYQKINLVLPEDQYFYYQTIIGFQKFCEENNLEYSLLDGISSEDVVSNEMYFVLNDHELFQIIKIAQSQQLDLGYDVGILSFNEKPFKAYLWHGISTINMNFDEIASHLLNVIMDNESFEPLDLSLQLIDRASF